MQARKEKIALILPNHLGDVVMATPALRALRNGRPMAEIHAVIREELAAVLGGSSWIQRLWTHSVYATRNPLQRLARRLALARALRGMDCVIVLPNSFSSALLAFAMRAPRRVGYKRAGRGWLLTDALPPPRENGRVVPIAMERYYLDLVGHLGCPDTGTTLELFTDAESVRECDALFRRYGIDPDRPLVCFAPGAGFGPSKLWPLRYVAEVARKLLDEGLQVALVHAPGEEALAEEILALTGPGPACLGGEGMNLALLKAILAHANLLICNDAGARHIAAAFRVPTLVMMGPTSIHYTNLNLRLTRLLREPVECSPCQLKVCPIDHRCMTRLLPSRVLGEAHTALSDEGWQGDVQLELRG
jgi:heptosyltransferase-2